MIHGFGDSGITSWTDVSKNKNFHPFLLLCFYRFTLEDSELQKSVWFVENGTKDLLNYPPPLSLPSFWVRIDVFRFLLSTLPFVFMPWISRNCLKSRKRQEKGHHCALNVLRLTIKPCLSLVSFLFAPIDHVSLHSGLEGFLESIVVCLKYSIIASMRLRFS